MNAFHIVIPCKGLTSGKSRLSEVLTARERALLCRRLLSRTVRVAVEAAGRDGVTVVSADQRVRDIARRLGASVLDDEGRDLNEALDFANASTVSEGRGLMVLPIDLPLVTAALLRSAAEQTGGVGIAPDTTGTGTNLLIISPDIREAFPFAFGPDSFRLHREAGIAHGASVVVLVHVQLAFDLDRPADLSALKVLKVAETGR